ncbi:NAD(P)/FAD-dependent oxidoreductase [Mesonia aestuariivivens]|uniref:FAD-binding oxidoreductase n=1 Tax=Mesonia aestuariivivens TaxID=2796128 RepID=A0ABS6W3E8_9FLAO|nr:FAD-binding oxidoreductase [Mesonia aestuariivivens]MBW2962390.1 FAD-binding oxidoreductase [Mesonia aestuariivivens]
MYTYMNVDYIIVGFGLAGLNFAEKLRQEKKSFVVFDNESEDASLVAGGIFNPVILKRFTLAWNADEQLSYAKQNYENIENFLEETFLTSKKILRRFNSAEEQNNWFTAGDKNRLAPFLNSKLIPKVNGMSSEFSFGQVDQTGLINTNKLISSYKSFLKKNLQLIEEAFNYESLDIQENSYRDLKFNHIVFAEGYGLRNNPFFNHLPLVGNKGEYITIKCEGLNLEEMIKFSLFILPLGENFYKVGATYEINFEDRLPTEKAKQLIKDKLDAVLKLPYTVVKQESGVRPTTKDRRPFIGRHHQYANIYINNGYGSRGIIISPSAAHWLYNFIENNEDLPAEVNVDRFN